MLNQMIKDRNIPDLFKLNDGSAVTALNWNKRRAELLDILSENIYGYTPQKQVEVSSKLIGINSTDKRAFAGKYNDYKYELSFETPKGIFTFPLYAVYSPVLYNQPAVLHIAFRDNIPHTYMPVEEICDRGVALFMFCYSDIVPDSVDGKYDKGLAAHYINDQIPRAESEWGKLGMWAYAASRAMDFIETLENINPARVMVAGHSRLGKTALWASAQDERFYMTFSNNSGYGGAALARGGRGERINDFIQAGSYDWFCRRFAENAGKDEILPYDQHFLLSLIAPRLLYVSSAEIDPGADPDSEFLSCFSAGKTWDMLGDKGFITSDEMPGKDIVLHEGKVGYHRRPGLHYFSRQDWNRALDFFLKNL